MLSPAEEKERALKVAKLYGKPIKRPRKQPVPFHPLPALKAGVILIAPFISFVGVLNLYMNSSYSSATDIQAASILLVVAIVGIALLTRISLVATRRTLEQAYAFSEKIFWIGLLVAFMAAHFGFYLTSGHSPQGFVEIGIRIVAFSAIITTISVIGNILLAYGSYVLEKRSNSD